MARTRNLEDVRANLNKKICIDCGFPIEAGLLRRNPCAIRCEIHERHVSADRERFYDACHGLPRLN